MPVRTNKKAAPRRTVKKNKKYQVIYADPPWRYDFSKDSKDKIENHYPTMSLEEIKNMQIPSEDNSVLYLWATAPKIEQAFEVMKAWGYTYITQSIWDKDWIGMGYWFRGTHEILMVGKKGKFSPPSPKFRMPSIYKERRTAHSKKPQYYRDLIKNSFPEASRIELFAREPHAGWDVWGNEVSSNVEIKY
tara:strand:+ start:70415 stop:70984 length:570 start_codon:yes stop_codon:yes gene_type:complete